MEIEVDGIVSHLDGRHVGMWDAPEPWFDTTTNEWVMTVPNESVRLLVRSVLTQLADEYHNR